MMNRLIVILAIVLLSSCCSKRVVSKVDSSDSTSIVRREYKTDSIAKKEKAEQSVASISNAVVIIEDIVYDTDKADSAGVAPIKQRKTTRIDYGNATTIKTEKEIQVDSTASVTDSLTIERKNITIEDRVEEKSSHPPWIWIVVIIVLFLGLIGLVGFLR